MPKITGTQQVKIRLDNITGPKAVSEISQALFEAGKQVQVQAQFLITQGSVSGKGHVASLPGEPPNNNWGTLAGNIEAVMIEPLLCEISSDAPYARALEDGTIHIKPRPYMKPALAAKRKVVTDYVRAACNKIIAKYGS